MWPRRQAPALLRSAIRRMVALQWPHASRRNLPFCALPQKLMSPPRLLNQLREVARLRHLSVRTEKAYIFWIRRYVLFHGKRHPTTMGTEEIRRFLSHLAVDKDVAASTQNQALAALLFLYRRVLSVPLPDVGQIERARKPVRLPVVLTRDDAGVLLTRLDGTPRLVAGLLYGSGLRLLEALRLRVKDPDFQSRSLVVRRGNGGKDPITILPDQLCSPLESHLEEVRKVHRRDLA